MERSTALVRALVTGCVALLCVATPASAQTTAPVAAYNFDEPTGTVALDTSGNANNGTIVGPVRSASGRYGGALSFDGSDDLVNVADADSLDLSGALTLSAWVNPSSVGGWRTVVIKERPAGLAYALYSDTDSNRPSGHVFTSAEVDTRGTAQVPANTWTHVATTYDGAAVRLFINGTQASSQAANGPVTLSGGALRIGGNAVWGEYFAGRIDDVRVYSRALTASELQADMATPVGDVDTKAPSAPGTPTFTLTDTRRINLAWNAATDDRGVDHYEIHRSASDGFTPSASTLRNTSVEPAYNELASAPGTLYYRVVAVDRAGNAGPASGVVAAVVPADTSAPTVTISTPAQGQSVTNVVTVRATADEDWGVTGWQFEVDGGSPVDSTSGTFAWDTRTLSPGSHTVVAIARDAAGNVGRSPARTVNVFRPIIPTITSPAAGTTVSGTVTVRATTETSENIGSVEFSAVPTSGSVRPVGRATTAPYEASWDTTQVPDGTYALQATLNDTFGYSWNSARVEVTVSNGIGIPSAPRQMMATVTGDDVGLTWLAPSTGPEWVQSYNVHRGSSSAFAVTSANRIATVTSRSYTDLDRPNGTSYYRVVAVNALLQTSPASGSIMVIVEAPDTTAPAVSISSPCGGAALSGTFNVAATASDNRGVTSVQFRVDGADLGAADTTSPYGVAWDTRTAANGAHTLTAVARDAAGNTTTSASCAVVVDNAVVPPASDLVAAYGFEETSGTTALDASGRGQAGTINGATRVSTGRFGRALSFDGANDLVEVPHSSVFSFNQALTLEAWVRPTTVAGWRTALMKELPNGLLYALYASTDNGLPSGHVTTSGEVDTRGTSALPVNTWSHLAATYDGTALRLFVNGAQVASRPVSGAVASTSGALTIGGNHVWSEWFSGQIDEVRVYRRALTAAEIADDMGRAVS